jgi:hypothetical protein
MMNGIVPRTGTRFTRSALLAVAAWQFLAGGAGALDILETETRWGFNGKVAVNRFNILSVRVNNPLPQPFEGELRLQKSLGDAPIIEVVTVAPFQTKWVQFYPYINGGYGGVVSNDTWRLYYGRGQVYELPPPRPAKYQRVILDDASGLGGRGGVLKQMPENLFPAFVSATDALQVVGIDREPRSWIPPQKEAFLDWLSLGGTVLLFHGPNGKFPEFSGPLAVLNSPLDERRHGSGRILKIPMSRGQFNADEARQALAGLPKNIVAYNDRLEDPIDIVDSAAPDPAAAGNAYSEGADPFVASSFMSQLKDMTKPDHNWLLLHFMFWVYIAMVFPGCYILGKRWSDFRVVYAGLLGTVTLFSLLFSIVGQRGYGEATAVHSVAIARSLPDGGLDVSSWSNVFVTGGGKYAIKHNGLGALYSTCSETERVGGEINNGLDGSFDNVDIPPFSNREFALRIKLPGGSPKITVDEHTLSAGRLTNLVLSVDGIPPGQTSFMYALSGDRFHMLHWNGDKLKLSADAGDATAVLKLQQMQNWSQNRYGYGYGYNQQQSPQERFNLMFSPLMSRSLGVSKESEARQVRLPEGIVRVFLYTKMPADFAIQNTRLGAQDGQVLYCVDVPLEP